MISHVTCDTPSFRHAMAPVRARGVEQPCSRTRCLRARRVTLRMLPADMQTPPAIAVEMLRCRSHALAACSEKSAI